MSVAYSDGCTLLTIRYSTTPAACHDGISLLGRKRQRSYLIVVLAVSHNSMYNSANTWRASSRLQSKNEVIEPQVLAMSLSPHHSFLQNSTVSETYHCLFTYPR